MTQVQAFFYKTFEKFNNDLYLWKSEVTTIKKGKIFNISLNIAHFSKFVFLQSLISTCTIHCVNLMVFLNLALNLETYFKNVTFWKISFCHSFLNKIKYSANLLKNTPGEAHAMPLLIHFYAQLKLFQELF